MLTLLPLVNTYFGVNFSNPPTQDQKLTIQECANFIVDNFPMIGLKEPRLAFSLASAGKFKGLNLETYYGKLSVQFIGKILSAYREYRAAIIAKYEEEVTKEDKERKKLEQKDSKNTETKEQVIKAYNELKSSYAEDLELDESKIFYHWAKILVKEGIINFTPEEKLEIYKEAKELVLSEMKQQFGVSQDIFERRTLKGMIDSIVGSDLPEDQKFKNRAESKYSILLVIKSIINANS